MEAREFECWGDWVGLEASYLVFQDPGLHIHNSEPPLQTDSETERDPVGKAQDQQ